MPDEQTVLVIEDEPSIRRVVRPALEAEGLRVLEADTGEEGLDIAAAARPSLILLDLALPGRSGLSVCRELRGWCKAPIVVLSSRQSEREKVALLDAGADDYVTKPFSTAELRARVRAHLRRLASGSTPARTTIELGDLRVEMAGRVVTRGGAEIHLTPIEWELLRTFLRYAGRTLTHEQLFAEVWPGSSGDPPAYLRVHVANLRRKLEQDPLRPQLIITEPGVGYRFRSMDPA